MKMYLRLLLKFILVSTLALVQLSFVSGLPFWAKELNLVIVFLVLLLEFGGTGRQFWWFLLIGFIFDAYSPLPFGLFIFLWPLTFVFARFLSIGFFTNHSLYSFLGLTFFTTIFYYFFVHLFFYFWKILIAERAPFFLLVDTFWASLVQGVVFNLALVAVLFYGANLLTDRLKPVFIFKK